MAQAGEEHTTRDGTSGNDRPPLTQDARDLLESLDTGDLVLFDRPCLKMGGFFGAAVCAAAKFMGGSPFDHIGVVVKDENGLNAMVEASFSGVAVRPLRERVRRSSASQICVRRLQVHRTEDMRAEARRFVSEVADLPYKEGGEGVLQMVAAAFRFHPAKEQRRRCHAETVALSTSIASLEKELTAHPEAGNPTQGVIAERLRRAITRRRKAVLSLNAPSVSETPRAQPPAAVTAAAREEPRVVGVAAAAIAESARAPTDSADENQKHGDGLPASPPALDPVSPHAPAQSPPPPSSSTSSLTPLPIFPPPYYDGGMFCSELVAALYQRLGLLDAPFPARHDYVPADFAQSLGNPVGRLGVDTDENATAEDNTNAEVTATATGGDRIASNGETRRTQAPGDKEACAVTLLPPPIPEGGGRVALLRGAALGPGCWLRGGPPAPRSLGKDDGEEEEGQGQGDRRSRKRGGGGAERPTLLAAAPTGTETSSSSRLRFSPTIAAVPCPLAAVVHGLLGAGKGGEIGTALIQERTARQRRCVGVGDARYSSHGCFLRWCPGERLIQASPRGAVAAEPFRTCRCRPAPQKRWNPSGMDDWRKKLAACTELTSFRVSESAIGRAVTLLPSSFSPDEGVAIATTAAAATAVAAVTAAAAAASAAFARSKISEPVVFGRCGPLLLLVGSGAAYLTVGGRLLST